MRNMKLKTVRSLALFPVLMLVISGVRAQDSEAEHEAMPMDHGSMHQDGGAAMADSMPGMKAGSGGNAMSMSEGETMEMDMSGMQGGRPPADARDPHAYDEGVDFTRYPRPQMADEENFSMLSIDRLENAVSDDNSFLTWDLQGWYGRDFNRLVLKSEGEYDNGTVEDADTELLWGRALTAYWDTQIGMRYDSGEAPDRSWLAFGIQGLAPYWFEVDATAYLGESGQTAFSLEAEYDLFLTQKMTLQPRLEANLYSKSDPDYGQGSGLNDLSLGLRLQYQFRREITAYAGVEWVGLFGETKEMARAEGMDDRDTRFVAGMRLWF